MLKDKKEAVVLLSGGLDSTTVLAMAMAENYSCSCLSFRYGQKQSVELERADLICRKMGVRRHLILDIGLDAIGGSALTDDIEVPKDQSDEMMSAGIPVTYVPARNIIFLSYAVSWAEVLGVSDIFLGINAVDFSGYPDCRPEFLRAYEMMANLGTKAGVDHQAFTFHAPLISMTKKEIIQQGVSLGVDYSLTHSCYDPMGQLACGRCDACRFRKQGFAEAGVVDPAVYVESTI